MAPWLSIHTLGCPPLSGLFLPTPVPAPPRPATPRPATPAGSSHQKEAARHPYSQRGPSSPALFSRSSPVASLSLQAQKVSGIIRQGSQLPTERSQVKGIYGRI